MNAIERVGSLAKVEAVRPSVGPSNRPTDNNEQEEQEGANVD